MYYWTYYEVRIHKTIIYGLTLSLIFLMVSFLLLGNRHVGLSRACDTDYIGVKISDFHSNARYCFSFQFTT